MSVVAGFIGGADILTILLRAAVFSAFGFGFAAGASILIEKFLPELAESGGSSGPDDLRAEDDSGESAAVGGSVDVSIGGEEDELAPFASSDGEEGILSPAALDQGPEGGYTSEERAPASPAVAARPPELVGDVDVLPDLEGFSDSFVSPIAMEGTGGADDSRRPASSGSSAGGSGGQFDAKEMAMAIQTILKRDQKG